MTGNRFVGPVSKCRGSSLHRVQRVGPAVGLPGATMSAMSGGPR
ncbi:MAG: hypothetical protein JWR45_1946 [Blastococcus sp.]|jgi:hypothetical protein|nr:hypothetical protein [Blastococcus sp.]